MNFESLAEIGLKLVVVLAAGYAAFAFAKVVIVAVQPNPVAEYLGTGKRQQRQGPSFADTFGAAVAAKLPISLERSRLDLVWAQRGGAYPGRTLEQLVFQAALLGALGLVYPLLVSPAPAAWFVPAGLAYFPFLRLGATATRMRGRAERAVPEMSSVIAAETAAGVSPEEAILQASKMPGPLAVLIREAIAHSAYVGIPLFSHDHQKGALRKIFEESGIPALRSFGVQLDVAASKGVEVSQRMSEISSSLAGEYRQRLMKNARKLDTNLILVVVLFYFVPLMGLILFPLLQEAANAF